MKRRAPFLVLLAAAAVAVFMTAGMVWAAGGGPDLGRSVVVSPPPGAATSGDPGADLGTDLGGAPTGAPPPGPDAVPRDDRAAEAGATPAPTKRTRAGSVERTARAEPVRPASPPPGGGDDDDDDDDGADDDD